MDARDEIIKARVRLQQENPFFSYLVMGLNLVEEVDNPLMPTCAVDMRGNLYFNPEFINKLNQAQVKTLLSHEVLHIALLHLLRVESVIPELKNSDFETGVYDGNPKTKTKLDIWNLATDLVINNTLILNGFEFGGELDKGLIPRNNEFNFKGDKFKVKDIDKKIAEEIYNEIYNKAKEIMKKEGYNGFDNHIYLIEDDGKSKGVRGRAISKAELEKLGKDWKKRLVEAGTYAKIQGKEPLGLGRHIDKILNSKMNWRELLYRYITQEIPIDYNWNLPSKRSQVLKVYMPRVKKELVDISVAIDTSGSIGKEELTEFLSEVVGISKAFDSIRVNIFFIDAKVYNHYVLNNGNYEEVLNYEIQGGGGTDFSKVEEYLDEKIPHTKLLVFFTDGYASFPKDNNYKTLWVLTKNSCPESNIPYGEVIKLE